jgi:hypothetical protein
MGVTRRTSAIASGCWAGRPDNWDVSNPLTELLGQGGSYNWGRYLNPRLEQLRPMIVNEVDQERRTGLIREALTIVRNDVPMIPLHYEPQVMGVLNTVEDFQLGIIEDVRLFQVAHAAVKSGGFGLGPVWLRWRAVGVRGANMRETSTCIVGSRS